jgi:hypothetical protein
VAPLMVGVSPLMGGVSGGEDVGRGRGRGAGGFGSEGGEEVLGVR